MTKQQEFDLNVAYQNKARALEELFFCTVNLNYISGHRRDSAIRAYAEACIIVDKTKRDIK